MKRPLIPFSVVMAALDCDARAARARVEDGSLEYAFDIRTRDAGRPCVRVFAGSLAAAQGRPVQTRDFEAVIGLILPRSYDPTAAVVARRFHCTPRHILHLAEDGGLRLAAGARCRPGPGGSPRICRQSLAAFLKQRRMV